jgi:hypothetical protein
MNFTTSIAVFSPVSRNTDATVESPCLDTDAMQRWFLLSFGILSILQNILVKTDSRLQVSDLALIARILSHPLISHVFEKLHSDPQADHQVHLVQTTIANASANSMVLDLTANVWCDVLLDA